MGAMKQRSFQGIPVSEVGLGCWQLGGGDWGAMDDSAARAILRSAYESGVTFFDTADVYGGGVSEQRLGAWLATDKPHGIFVATKLGRRGDPGWPGNFSPAALRQHTTDSLKRLGIERLELTQLHCIPTEEFRKGEVFDTLRQLQSEGLIARFGASVESMEEALICLEQEGLASLQIIFNLFRQKPIEMLFARAKAKNVALIVRLPLASGLLSGKYTTQTEFAASDHRTYNRDGAAFNVGETFAGLPFALGVELADALKPLVPEGWTLAQLAQRWILDFDAVTTVIPGATSLAQVESNVSASSLPPLSEALHQQLSTFYQTHVASFIRGPY
jgi:aryl-alcohol dehydrogenase-like predicted oxidoreductase